MGTLIKISEHFKSAEIKIASEGGVGTLWNVLAREVETISINLAQYIAYYYALVIQYADSMVSK